MEQEPEYSSHQQTQKSEAIEPPKGAQAALRTIRMLKSFTTEYPEQSLAQVSSRLGLNKTTAHRLLAALESEFLIERNPTSGAYRLGQGTLSLGLQAIATNDLRTRIRPIMETLARRCKETTTLEILSGNNVIIVDEVDGGNVVGAVGHIGTRWPAHATSTGKAIIAEHATWNLPIESSTPLTNRTITDPSSFDRELDLIRKRGYAIAKDELEIGYSAVAIALHEPSSPVRAAIALGGPTSRLNRIRCRELGEILRVESMNF